MSHLKVTGRISIPETELEESFIQASGPGGQNVNKVATAVQMRFDVAHSPSLPEEVRERLMAQLGPRLTNNGELVIDARRFRSRERNREDARERLAALIRKATQRPVPRRPTKPTKASKRRRLEAKKARGTIKRARAKPAED
ncbi:alternative ribosome rescue aminoacyl-tRNA hydrolase ArfB [Fodinicurvata sediminis]|uniref:alternative ribosome rescue aminoacyl-tRNA hydrolase ArfB n=1 Tax=Fodinicurvata sediminis TaxID=1121832 RepID=UPI0003B598B2|nr:alternative ribosome rescue aminoacyl-tRNA hydrolase ArfB [Fodinicurvata sediminis]